MSDIACGACGECGLTMEESKSLGTIESLRQQLAECQAREKRRLELMTAGHWMDAQAVQSDSTALSEAIKQAKRASYEACEKIAANCEYKIPYRWGEHDCQKSTEVHTPKHAGLAIAEAIRARMAEELE